MNSRLTRKLTARTTQAGVVLAMALILLVIVSLMAVMAVRSTISGEQVAKSVRTNAAAMQAAETALRYCEDQVIRATSGVLVINPEADGEAVLWKTRSNWNDTSKANALTGTIVNSADAAARKLPAGALPRCMVERPRIRNADPSEPREAFLVTAVGYSPDYRVSSSGKVESGGEVWLQSIVRR